MVLDSHLKGRVMSEVLLLNMDCPDVTIGVPRRKASKVSQFLASSPGCARRFLIPKRLIHNRLWVHVTHLRVSRTYAPALVSTPRSPARAHLGWRPLNKHLAPIGASLTGPSRAVASSHSCISTVSDASAADAWKLPVGEHLSAVLCTSERGIVPVSSASREVAGSWQTAAVLPSFSVIRHDSEAPDPAGMRKRGVHRCAP